MIKTGSRVRYSARWLQATERFTGDLPQARGLVTGIESRAGLRLAHVRWDQPGPPQKVNIKNLALEEMEAPNYA